MKLQTSRGPIDQNDLNRLSASERMQYIRGSYIEGVRTKGFQFTTAAGGNTDNKLDLSGQGTNFLGFAIFPVTSALGLTVNLTINNDVVCQATPAVFLVTDGRTQERSYYPLQRLLNGQDTITLGLNQVGAAQTVLVVVWYQ